VQPNPFRKLALILYEACRIVSGAIWTSCSRVIADTLATVIHLGSVQYCVKFHFYRFNYIFHNLGVKYSNVFSGLLPNAFLS